MIFFLWNHVITIKLQMCCIVPVIFEKWRKKGCASPSWLVPVEGVCPFLPRWFRRQWWSWMASVPSAGTRRRSIWNSWKETERRIERMSIKLWRVTQIRLDLRRTSSVAFFLLNGRKNYILMSCLYGVLGLEFLNFIPWIAYLLISVFIPLRWELVHRVMKFLYYMPWV